MSNKISEITQKGWRTLDLFAGVGGIRFGFEKAGFRTVFANDLDKTCKDTYDLNFEAPKLTVGDIWDIIEFIKFCWKQNWLKKKIKRNIEEVG